MFVVLNNGGGHIFDLLPLAAERADMSAWTTPQTHSMAELSKSFGVHHVMTADVTELREALLVAVVRPGPTCIEVIIPPDAARTERASLLGRLDREIALAASQDPDSPRE